MALELAIARGRALALVEDAKGTMAAVSCPPVDALAHVASKREIVCPNLGFRHQLEIYAARLRGHRKLRRGGTLRPRAT